MRCNHKIWSLLTEFEQKHEQEWHEINHEILRQMYPGRNNIDQDLLLLLESMTDQDLEMFVNAARKRSGKGLKKYGEGHLREKFKNMKKKKTEEEEKEEEE
jgi:hypothetical protein